MMKLINKKTEIDNKRFLTMGKISVYLNQLSNDLNSMSERVNRLLINTYRIDEESDFLEELKFLYSQSYEYEMIARIFKKSLEEYLENLN